MSARTGRSRCSAAVVPDLLGAQPPDLDHRCLHRIDTDVRARRPARPAAQPAASEPAPSAWTRPARTASTLMSAISSTSADHDQVLGGERHLAHQMRGDEYRPSLARQLLQQLPHPLDTLGVKSVHRLVEHHHVRVAEQRGRDPETLSHSEREAAGALAARPPRSRRARSAHRPVPRPMPCVWAIASRWL